LRRGSERKSTAQGHGAVAAAAARHARTGLQERGHPELSLVTHVNQPAPSSEKISVSEQSNTQEFDQLDRINSELTASLKSCRAILRDCQEKLAANSNELEEAREGPESS
jgi:hypothetical protein